MTETATSDTNATELEHDDGRADPAREGFICGKSIVGRDALAPAPTPAGEVPAALYDVEGRGYGCLYAPDPGAVSGERTVKPKGVLCDDPGSLCDDSLLAV